MIPIIALENINKIFITFKRPNSEYDDWICLVVEISKLSTYFMDPKLSSDIELLKPLVDKLKDYEKIVFDWMVSCNWIPEVPFPCNLYSSNEQCFEVLQNNSDSGIYMITMIDLLSHDVPRCFRRVDTYTFRQNICYSILRNYIPH